MKISEIKDILDAEVLSGEGRLDDTVIGGGAADLMEDVLSAAAKDAVILTGLTTENVLRTALISGAGAIVFVRGKKPDGNFIELTKAQNIPILLTRYSLFIACGKLYMNGLRGLDGSW
jgi:predicted transcriptional regulator